nr:ATP-binding cassette domain-containing protein [Allomuricauda sp.]
MISIQIQKKLNAAKGEMWLDLNLTIKEGQLVTLYGESGAGKTSTLRILGGLLKPDEGKIVVEGNTWYDSKEGIDVNPQKRKLGFVFQDYALFPHMTVLENLEFASGKKNHSKVDHLLDLMELGDLKDEKPKKLSGGQQQRVALARALAQNPKLLLLDEPLSALDLEFRRKLQQYLLNAHREFGLTTILVSHDLEEIFKLSDWVFELNDGKIRQQGTPEELFGNPEIKKDFKVTGELLGIEQNGSSFELQILVQNHMVKINATQQEVDSLKVGDTLILASNDFQPKLYKKKK